MFLTESRGLKNINRRKEWMEECTRVKASWSENKMLVFLQLVVSSVFFIFNFISWSWSPSRDMGFIWGWSGGGWSTRTYHTIPYHTTMYGIPYHTMPYVIWSLFEVGPLVAQPHDRHASSLTSGDERRILRGDNIEWRRGRDGEKWKYEISREAKGGAGVVGKRGWVKDNERRLMATHSEKECRREVT